MARGLRVPAGRGLSAGGSGSGIMLRDLQLRFSRTLLTVVTVAAVLAALLNVQQQKRFELPDDGAIWVDGRFGVEAKRVMPEGPAYRSGVRPGDVLLAINGVEVKRALHVPQILLGIGTWRKAEYRVLRHNIELRP